MKKKHTNNPKDALIGETVFRNGFVLVTDDRTLKDIVNDIGGTAISLSDFLLETKYKSIT